MTSSPRGAIALSAALASFSQLAAYILVPATVLVDGDLPGVGAWLLPAYLFTVAIAQVGWGPASDSLGRRGSSLAGLVVGIGGTLVCAFASAGLVLVIGRIVQAGGFAVCLVNSRALVRDRFSGRALTSALATTTVWIAVVPSVTPIVGGWVAQVLGWRPILLGVAGLAVILGSTVLVALRDDQRSSGAREGAVGAAGARRSMQKRLRTAWTALSIGYADGPLVRASLAGACHFGALSVVMVRAPQIVHDVSGGGPLAAGTVIATMTPLFLIGALMARGLAGRAGTRAMRVMIGIQIACVALAALCISGSGGADAGVVAAIGAMSAYCTTQGILLPRITSAALDRVTTGSGVAASTFGSLQLAGGGVATAIAALVAPLGLAAIGTLVTTLLFAALLLVRDRAA